MKAKYFIFVFFLAVLTGCSTTRPSGSAKADPETMQIVYHARPGKEAELQGALASAWQIYRAQHLVFAEPHIIIRDTEDGTKARFVEVFTWVSRAIPEHAPDAVQKVWGQEQSLCEARGGHDGIEIGEVELITGK